MKILSKIISVLLLITMLAGCLAACGGTGAGDNGGGGTVTPPEDNGPGEFIDYVATVKLDRASGRLSAEATVKAFIDGDTTHFYVDESVSPTGVLKARYLAINTPESTGQVEPWGKAASNFTKEKLSAATSIIIESDDARWNLDSTGDRHLVWVWYKTAEMQDYRNLNLEIMQEGLAIASSYMDYAYGTVCRDILSQAVAHKLHVHDKNTPDPNFYYGSAQPMTLKELKTTVVMYPEAGYSFDGTATTLPDTLGGLLKLLKVPVVTIITRGAFSREPLYNMLRHRKVDISADVTYLLSPDQIKEMSADELNAVINEAFSFDNFKWQQENNIVINEDFRADGLQRVLFKCPHCLAEGQNVGKGVTLTCKECGKTYELTELGALKAVDGESAFTHVPDWYAWERACVREEIERGEYLLDVDVDVYMLVDYKGLYRVGEGHLVHNAEGFRLTGCGGELDYSQSPISSYSLNADYFWRRDIYRKQESAVLLLPQGFKRHSRKGKNGGRGALQDKARRDAIVKISGKAHIF